jgi:hypothetical protein
VTGIQDIRIGKIGVIPLLPTVVRDAVLIILLMTGAGTIAILADRFIATVSRLVLVWFIVTFMTARTVRLISGASPVDDLGIRLVA